MSHHLYHALTYAAITEAGQFEASGTLCGHIDFASPGNGTFVLSPVEALQIAHMLQQARLDVLKNSDPLGDPRLVDRSPMDAPLKLSGSDPGLRTSGAALGDKSAHLALVREALEPFADLDDGTEVGLCDVLLDSSDLRRARSAFERTAQQTPADAARSASPRQVAGESSRDEQINPTEPPNGK